jgi:hypothetical protein
MRKIDYNKIKQILSENISEENKKEIKALTKDELLYKFLKEFSLHEIPKITIT